MTIRINTHTQHKIYKSLITNTLLIILPLLYCITPLYSFGAESKKEQDSTATTKNTYKSDMQASVFRKNNFSTQKQSKQALRLLANGDTLAYLNKMIQLSDLEKGAGNFNRSFDILSDLISNSEALTNKRPLMSVYERIGTLYKLFTMDSIALAYKIKGLEIGKQFAATQKKTFNKLVYSYLGVARQHMSMEHYDKTLQYLDTCYRISSGKENPQAIEFLHGVLYIKMGLPQKANIYLQKVVTYYINKGSSQQARGFYYLGEVKLALHQTDSAIYYYEKCLNAVDSFQINGQTKPKVLEKLALLYGEKNQQKKAFDYMHRAKYMSDSIVHLLNQHNKELFEVKSQYKEDLTKTTAQLHAQNKILQLKDKASFRLKLLIGILILLAAIAYVLIRMGTRMEQLVYEKTAHKEKNDAILEIKNKELTTNTLQVIEKENTIKELLDIIKLENPKKRKELDIKLQLSNQKLWDDFNLRFTQVNNKYYDTLLDLQPDLTPTDLKHCALIKLNFDSKEMAQVLGISLHGVHISRSRIRKKLSLQREDSLGNYLTNI